VFNFASKRELKQPQDGVWMTLHHSHPDIEDSLIQLPKLIEVRQYHLVHRQFLDIRWIGNPIRDHGK